MSDFQAIGDRVEIEVLRGEFTDAVMMNDYDRVAALFTPDGAWRMPDIPAELSGREQIRAWGKRRPADYLVQTTHPGTIQIDGDTASGRAYIQELGRGRDGRSGLPYAIYHDRYQRTGDGWKFTEWVFEVRSPDPAQDRYCHPAKPMRLRRKASRSDAMDGYLWPRRCRQALCTRASSARLHAHGLEEVLV